MSESDWEAACHHTDTCALTGSAAFFMGIPKSHVLVNGPLWCYFYALRYLEDAAGYLSQRMNCTQPGGTAIVYGTEDDLLRGFDAIKAMDTPERVFVENNCSISMIGDDIAGIAARADLPWPVYAMDSGGVRGGFAGGWEKGLLRVVQEMKPQETVPKTVNLLGATPFLLQGRQDTEEMKRLLHLAGYTVTAAPGAGSSWEEILRAPSASLNIVVRDELGRRAAEAMERDFGVPWISAGLPYGMRGTETWLARILAAAPGGNMLPVREEIRARNTALRHITMDMESLWGPLWFDRILIAALPSEAAGLAEAVRGEWADTERLTVLLQHPSEQTIPAADEVLAAGRDDAAVRDVLEGWTGGLVMGSSHETARLLRLEKPFTACHIAYPSTDRLFLTDLPFCGVRGAEYLCERLWNAKLAEQEKACRDRGM